LARGMVGLIISGYTFIRPDGKGLQGKMGIYTDDFEEDFKKMTHAVHAAGGTIAIQLVHAGGQTTAKNAGRQPLAPSSVKVDQFPEIPAELSMDDIRDIITAFGAGARRAKAWGFDAVQLHGAHGFLIINFFRRLPTAEPMITAEVLKIAAGSCSKCTKRCVRPWVKIIRC